MHRTVLALTLAALIAALAGTAPAAAQTSTPQSIVQAAMKKTATAGSYHVEMDVSAKGDLGRSIPGASGQQQISIMNLAGKVSGKDSDMKMGGIFMAFLGVEPTRPLHIITVGGKVYIRGPLPLFGAPEDRWYAMDSSQGFQLGENFPQESTLGTVTPDALAGITALGKEQVGGRSCDVYGSTDRAVVSRALSGLSVNSSAVPQQDLSQVEKADLRFLVCPDGYFHQMRLLMEGRAEPQSDDLMTVSMLVRFSEIGRPVSIVAPRDAIPAAPSSMPLGSPAAPAAPAAGNAATVRNGGNVRAAPSLQGQVLDQVNARETVTLLARTADGRWFKITNVRGVTGWVSVTLLTLPPGAAAATPVEGAAPAAGGLTATVFNGGNVRAAPSLRGQVLDQINARETATLLARTADGRWFKITNVRGVTGWVSVTLLTLPPGAAAATPVE